MSSAGSPTLRNYAAFKGTKQSLLLFLIGFSRFLFWNLSLPHRPPFLTATHLHLPLWWRIQPRLSLVVTIRRRRRRRSNQEAKMLLRLFILRHQQHCQCHKSPTPLSWPTFHPWADPALATCLLYQCQIGPSTLHLWNSLALNLLV